MLGYLLNPALQLEDIGGKPLVGGWLTVYRTGTTTPYITYSDFDNNRNPVNIVLNDLGMAVIIADNGSAYDIYAYDREGVQQWSRTNVTVGVGGGSGSTYTAGEGITINNDTHVVSADFDVVQHKLTAGDNITISDSTISANFPLLVAKYGSTTYAEVRSFALTVGKTAVCRKQFLTAVLSEEHIDDDVFAFAFVAPPNAKGQYHVFTLHNDDTWTDQIVERTHDLICQLKPIVISGQTSMRYILCDRQQYTVEQGSYVFQPVDLYQLAVWINRGDVIQIDGAVASDPWGDRYPMQIVEMQCHTDSGTNKIYCTNIRVRGYAYSPSTEKSYWGDTIVDEATNTRYLEFQTWT